MINLEVRDGDWRLKVDMDDRGSAGTGDPLYRQTYFTITYSWRGISSRYLCYASPTSSANDPRQIRRMLGEIWHHPDLERWKREVEHGIEDRNRTVRFQRWTPVSMTASPTDSFNDSLLAQW